MNGKTVNRDDTFNANTYAEGFSDDEEVVVDNNMQEDDDEDVNMHVVSESRSKKKKTSNTKNLKRRASRIVDSNIANMPS